MVHLIGVPAKKLSPEKISKRYPLLDTGKNDFGIYVPGDGIIKGLTAFVEILVGTAVGEGMKLYLETYLKKFEKKGNIFVVEAEHKGERIELTSNKVVVAAGHWTIDILKNSGISLPRGAVKRFTARVAEVETNFKVNELPFVFDDGNGFEFVPHSDNLLFVGGTDRIEVLEVERNERYLQKHIMQNFPLKKFGNIKILGIRDGIITLTKDKNPIAGEYNYHGKYEGLYIAVGCTGVGITMSLGLGQLLSDIILNQKTVPHKDELVRTCAPNRF